MTNYNQIAAAHKDDKEHVDGILSTFPQRWAFGFARKYQQISKKEGRQAANLYLIDRLESIKPHDIGLASSDDEICNLAKAKAKRYFERLVLVADFEKEYYAIAEEIKVIGVTAPKVKKNSNFVTLCSRFACDKWWRRALRVSIGRHIEQEAIKAGFVGFRAAYVSNETLERRQQQNRRNKQTLEWIVAENDAGYKSTLAELSAAGVANPANRRNELMTRIRGVEEEAKRKGLTCEFLTITAPSKYHATRYIKNIKRSISNPKYNGSNPRQAQDYLNDVWKRIRAEYGRKGIEPVGFRVAEPHKDGCPHWHLMLFVKHKDVKALRKICGHYARLEDNDELRSPEAYKARFYAKSINPNIGSAAGYIAKYIAKNVSMDNLEDFNGDGGDSVTKGLERTVAWAATWGIRQFQEIGNQVVMQWREFRRIRGAEGLPEVMLVLWKAADAGEYGAFIREAVLRQVSFIRENEKKIPLYEFQTVPNEDGEFTRETVSRSELVTAVFNRYGEVVQGAVRGLIVDGAEMITRCVKWVFTYQKGGGSGKAANNNSIDLFGSGSVLPAQNDYRLAEHVETGYNKRVEKSPIIKKKIIAFRSFIWEFASPKRKNVKGYPRPSKCFLTRVKPVLLGHV